jgi:hypothetical protein
MNWRDIVARWLVDKKATLEGNLGTMELVQLFVGRNIVPARLMDNATLHTEGLRNGTDFWNKIMLLGHRFACINVINHLLLLNNIT